MNKQGDVGFSDIPSACWIDRWVPAKVRPYCRLVRLDRPIGTWLLIFPGWWSIALASQNGIDLTLLVVFGLGAFVMRASGCIVNDLWDRDIDAQVERTRQRPLASRQLNLKQAIGLLIFLLGVGSTLLVQLSWVTIYLGLAILPLVVLYPLMKRITWWPQIALGIVFNWGALMGWSAVTGGIEWTALAVYLGAVAWTIGYDTVYAHQDKLDDARIGVRSAALRLGDFAQRKAHGTKPTDYSKRWVLTWYGITLLALGIAGWSINSSWLFWTALALASGMLYHQHHHWQIDEPASCLKCFQSNQWVGWVILAGMLLS